MSYAEHAQLADVFQAHYGLRPVAVARAPGRVNLIGEHIDYEGYGVLPMAVEQACFVAVGWREEQQQAPGPDISSMAPGLGDRDSIQELSMVITNTQSHLYPPGGFQLDPAAPSPDTCPGWFKYIHAAYKGCLEFAASEGQQVPSRGNILMMVHGNIPPGSGLSSSSALVVSAALALLALWGIPASPQQVAEFTCRCERYVGTEGGGMDQAVSVMAQQGLALHVEFEPVRSSPVVLPAAGVFVVANCLAPSLKAETAASRYNLRVLECRLAAMLLAQKLAQQLSTYPGTDYRSDSSSSSHDWRAVRVLQQVEAGLLQYATESHAQQQQSHLVRDHAERLQSVVQQLLPQASYTLEQVCQLLGSSTTELLSVLPAALQQAATGADQFCLQQRAVHVFSESQRVLEFKSICRAAGLSADEKLSQLGGLMDGSHVSCSGLYQCSCDELDSLVKVAKEAGALGARLTGAGWGGCVVALVHERQAVDFMAAVEQRYYRGRQQQMGDVSQYLFKTTPSAGATVKLMR